MGITQNEWGSNAVKAGEIVKKKPHQVMAKRWKAKHMKNTSWR